MKFVLHNVAAKLSYDSNIESEGLEVFDGQIFGHFVRVNVIFKKCRKYIMLLVRWNADELQVVGHIAQGISIYSRGGSITFLVLLLNGYKPFCQIGNRPRALGIHSRGLTIRRFLAGDIFY